MLIRNLKELKQSNKVEREREREREKKKRDRIRDETV